MLLTQGILKYITQTNREMSTTFGVKIPTEEEEIIVAYRGNGTGMFWRNPLAPYLPDDMRVIPLDNTAQGIKTIGDVRKAVNDKNNLNQ